MKVLTMCNEYKPHLPELIESCDGKLDLHVTIKAGQWKWRTWLDWQVEMCERWPGELLVFLDAYDVLFVGDPDELEGLVSRQALIHGTCKNSWPLPSRAPLYPADPSPWRFLNSCGPAGRSEDILRALKYGLICGFPLHPQDIDQRFWGDLFLQGFGVLDTKCEIWQDLWSVEEGELGHKDGRLRNLITGSSPQFIHASAKTWHYIPKELLDVYCPTT